LLFLPLEEIKNEPTHTCTAPSNALSFDGAGSFGVVPIASLNITNELTIELWVRFSTSANLVSGMYLLDARNATHGWYLWLDASSRLDFSGICVMSSSLTSLYYMQHIAVRAGPGGVRYCIRDVLGEHQAGKTHLPFRNR
jgi:hypothetical protein